jgi:hypothetical protein
VKSGSLIQPAVKGRGDGNQSRKFDDLMRPGSLHNKGSLIGGNNPLLKKPTYGGRKKDAQYDDIDDDD